MLIGGALEAVGIGAILPLISIMGQPDWLDRHANIAQIASHMGVTSHAQFIILCSIGLIILYRMKNACLAWWFRMLINFNL